MKKKEMKYNINCKNCDGPYVGQTGRKLKIRVMEHKKYINGKFSTCSVYRLSENHDFDWDNIEVLDTEKYYNKRLMSEMIFIKRQTNGLNLKTDTEILHWSNK